ncbi:MAG TPA: hypothetical protein VNA19_12800 [Pyrinomonadaceae bacterium]|jgi:hypothetical protein|nr:hypothetical protein [Pyrinomonadaceae bacterium]
MRGTKRDSSAEERFERLGREIVVRSASNDAEAEAVAASPFLYARVRARIAAERARREEGESWLALLSVVWRSAPAMALAAVFSFILFWSAGAGTTPAPAVLSDEALLGTRDAGIEHVVFADRQPLSSDEVLATILNEDEREGSR